MGRPPRTAALLRRTALGLMLAIGSTTFASCPSIVKTELVDIGIGFFTGQTTSTFGSFLPSLGDLIQQTIGDNLLQGLQEGIDQAAEGTT